MSGIGASSPWTEDHARSWTVARLPTRTGEIRIPVFPPGRRTRRCRSSTATGTWRLVGTGTDRVPPDPLVTGAHRVVVLDVLRGVALLGILLVNIWSVAETVPGTAPIDELVRDVRRLFLVDKFHMLFAFLFGYGIATQFERSGTGRTTVRRLGRRMAVLLLLGLTHDVLAVYAVAGAITVAMRRISTGNAVRAGVILLLAVAAFYGATALLTSGADVPAEPVPAPPGNLLADRLAELPTTLLSLPDYLALVLFGLAAGRRGLLHRREPTDAALWTVLVTGLVVGVPGAVPSVLAPVEGGLDPAAAVARGLSLLTAPAFVAAYVAGLLLLHRTGIGRRTLGVIVPAGRTALTNYLAQGWLCLLIFPAAGLVDRVPTLGTLAIALAIFALLLVASRWWLRRFRFGPVEWVLRSATYWCRQPLRRR
ncbi:hypothetical protein Ae168Ps1_3657 [Pseudonocardia sp. Ae168_Ps1]|nr:hypothetical protein Ae150APs1_3635 [Pseudonocardia sp. Ae150A_Ps1]OLL81251.1 hypothetical protein Ae168Ps1_3657 [Pseudonocardia sp. Ae168_Ps1]OLL84634.1 hypothetical protein Ae263Ps1_1689c [Pseudonocardia sp. Ae263_Ps1]